MSVSDPTTSGRWLASMSSRVSRHWAAGNRNSGRTAVPHPACSTILRGSSTTLESEIAISNSTPEPREQFCKGYGGPGRPTTLPAQQGDFNEDGNLVHERLPPPLLMQMYRRPLLP